jgi:predicted RNase H-like nuclease (RuvC/YqgF family)
MRWHPERFLPQDSNSGVKGKAKAKVPVSTAKRKKPTKREHNAAKRKLEKAQATVKAQKAEIRRLQRTMKQRVQQEKAKLRKVTRAMSAKAKKSKENLEKLERAKQKIQEELDILKTREKVLTKPVERWSRFLSLDTLPEKMVTESESAYLLRLVQQFQGEGLFNVDEVYKALADKTGHSHRTVYAAFFGYRPTKNLTAA